MTDKWQNDSKILNDFYALINWNNLILNSGLGHPKRESCAHMCEMYFFLKKPSDFFNN